MPKKKFEAIIESTMVGPLWARAEYGEKYPEIFYDPEAKDIINNLWKIFPEDHEGFKIMKKFVLVRVHEIDHSHPVLVKLGT